MLKPKIKQSHHILKDKSGDICIGELPGSSFIVRNPPKEFLSLLHILDGNSTVQRIIAMYRRMYPNITDAELVVAATINKLIELNLLEDASLQSNVLTQAEMELYDRQMLYYSQVEKRREPRFIFQERLKKCRVAVFGLGGWGTWVSQNLALNGFGHIRLVDGDCVEVSNLNRQVLYRFEHVGISKAIAAADSISKINPYITTEAIEEYVNGTDEQLARLLENIDVLFLAWVNLSSFVPNSIAEKIHHYALRKKIAIIEFGGDPLSIFVGPVFPNDGTAPCMECIREEIRSDWYGKETANLNSFREARISESYDDGARVVNAWQSSPSLSIMSGMAVDQIIKLITKCEPVALLGKRFYLSMQDFSKREISYAKKIDCIWCGGDCKT